MRLVRALKQAFARYVVVDSYSTLQDCWTLAEAMEWLPACSPEVYVVDAYSGRVVVARKQHEERWYEQAV